MQKRLIATAVGASAVVGYMLRNKESREKVKDAMSSVMSMINNNQVEPEYSTLEKAGIPDQLKKDSHGELEENSKMVSEGSAYGIHYYNEEVQENETLQ